MVVGNFGSYDVTGWLRRLKKPSNCQRYVGLSESVILFLFMLSKDTRWKYVVPSVIFVITGGIGMRVHSCCKAAGLK